MTAGRGTFQQAARGWGLALVVGGAFWFLVVPPLADAAWAELSRWCEVMWP